MMTYIVLSFLLRIQSESNQCVVIMIDVSNGGVILTSVICCCSIGMIATCKFAGSAIYCSAQQLLFVTEQCKCYINNDRLVYYSL